MPGPWLALVVLAAVSFAGSSGLAQLETVSLDLGSNLPLEWIRLPAGAFEQGSPESEADRGPDETRRSVTLSKPFLIGKFPITRAQFERFTSETRYLTEGERGTSGGFGWDGTAVRQGKTYSWKNPGFSQTPDHPVTGVTYGDALSFCRWLSTKSGRTFTLPTEAQWEYACRAGTTSAWHNGDSASLAHQIAWFHPTAAHQTHPVGELAPNPWGLHIGGNVAEWCLDWYGPYSPGPVTDPVQSNPNLSDKPRRVLRGGSWLRAQSNTRSAARYRNDPGSRNPDNGFRVVTFDLNPSPRIARSQPATAPPRQPDPPLNQPPPSATPQPPETPQPAPVANSNSPTPTTRPMVVPEAHTPLRSSSRGFFPVWLIGGVVAVGMGGLVALTFLLSRLKPSSLRARTASRSRSDLPNRGLSAPTIVDDGFWFSADADSVGHQLLYSYWLHGQLLQGRVVFQPDAEGRQFVYTGERPERITLQADTEGPDPDLPPPFLSSGPTQHDDPTPPRSGSSWSKSFPPAY